MRENKPWPWSHSVEEIKHPPPAICYHGILMRRVLIKSGGIALASYVGLCLLLFLLQRSLLYFPTKAPGAQASIVSLEVEDASLRISYRHHDGAAALIYFGGNAEDVANTLPQFATAFPNHAIYMPHYRGYGGSSGQPSESALHQDALALFSMVQAQHPEIILVGRSLGSGVAIRLAATNPISRLVLITPYDSILNVTKQKFPFLPVGLLLLDTYESWRFAPRVRAPTLILAASNDNIIPKESTRALYQSFSPGVATMRILVGTDHNLISTTAEYLTAIQTGK